MKKSQQSYKLLQGSLLFWECRSSVGDPVSAHVPNVYDRQELNWPTAIALVLLHVGAVAALFMFNCIGSGWRLSLSGSLQVLVSVWVTIACTRTDRTRFRSALSIFFAVCGALTFEGGPIFWVATHRIHHQKSDQPGDPHSPRDGVLGTYGLDSLSRR